MTDTPYAPGRGFEYEIGKPRTDGKHNIWRKVDIGIGYGRRWVIVEVADSFKEALRWIKQQRRAA